MGTQNNIKNTYRTKKKIAPKKKTISCVAIIVLIVSNLTCVALLYKQVITNKEYAKKIENYTNEINNLINLQKEKIDEQCVIYYQKHLSKLLNEYDLMFLANKQWKYAISLNGEIINKNTIYIEDDYIHLILAEIVEDKDILPIEILKQGSISGADPNELLKDHINVFTTIDYTTNTEEQDCNKRVIYDFKNIPKGTVINLKLSFLLSARLQIGKGPEWENRIEIIRK